MNKQKPRKKKIPTQKIRLTIPYRYLSLIDESDGLVIEFTRDTSIKLEWLDIKEDGTKQKLSKETTVKALCS